LNNKLNIHWRVNIAGFLVIEGGAWQKFFIDIFITNARTAAMSKSRERPERYKWKLD
jgi:hypothetical protein